MKLCFCRLLSAGPTPPAGALGRSGRAHVGCSEDSCSCLLLATGAEIMRANACERRWAAASVWSRSLAQHEDSSCQTGPNVALWHPPLSTSSTSTRTLDVQSRKLRRFPLTPFVPGGD